MFDVGSIRAVTFDCYGTLIDWEAGILAYVTPHLLREAPLAPTPEAWLERWEPIQFGLLRPWRPYAEVLMESFEATMRSFAMPSFSDGGPGLVRSLGEWAPFPDTVPALRKMARRRRLGIISNIDRQLMAQTLGQLLAPIGMVVTAEDVQAYKPDEAPFRRALEQLGLAPGEVLHAAFGWKYDLGPAKALGMRTCWVNRGGIARPQDGVVPDLEVPSLKALADVLEG
ncbi:MAG TPA: HAD-IA family hydrolase [Polyangia bacterium]|jgi:2-haloalkanoic acid dehalogenase type II|nr:HAD-IA family hydrolase [Polyangia bacterium]